MVALQGFFNLPFDLMPPALRPIVVKIFFPWDWDSLTPGRRRSVALQWDADHHPGLSRERGALWEKLAEIDGWERTGSDIPREKKRPKDAKMHQEELQKLRDELADLERAALQKAAALGLAAGAWPYGGGVKAPDAAALFMQPGPASDALPTFPPPEPAATAGAPPPIPPVGGVVPPSKAPLLPIPTDPAVRQWMRDRVNGWPDDKPAPSESKDLGAVFAYFAPGLTRDEFRLVRKGETPPEWRTQGRRPPWGEAKRQSAANPPICDTQI